MSLGFKAINVDFKANVLDFTVYKNLRNWLTFLLSSEAETHKKGGKSHIIYFCSFDPLSIPWIL